jgi:hypothetical protein
MRLKASMTRMKSERRVASEADDIRDRQSVFRDVMCVPKRRLVLGLHIERESIHLQGLGDDSSGGIENAGLIGNEDVDERQLADPDVDREAVIRPDRLVCGSLAHRDAAATLFDPVL